LSLSYFFIAERKGRDSFLDESAKMSWKEEVMASVNSIPKGYHSVTPYLIVKDAAKALDFYKKAFNATELFRMQGEDGKIGHAEIKIGDSPVMLADEMPERGYKSPQSVGGTPVSLMIYVEDVDAIAKQAEGAGIKVKQPVKDQFYGDRSGNFEDPFGHIWTIATHIEDVAPEEMKRRIAKMTGESHIAET
jgi:PhnB protein